MKTRIDAIAPGSAGRATRGGGRQALLAVLTSGIPALLVVQVYLAGLFLMGGVDARDEHVTVGRALLVYPVVLLPVAYGARAASLFWLALAMFWAAAVVQAALPELSTGDASGWLRALHTVLGVVLVGLGLRLARAAWSREQVRPPEARAQLLSGRKQTETR